MPPNSHRRDRPGAGFLEIFHRRRDFGHFNQKGMQVLGQTIKTTSSLGTEHAGEGA
jgi:hypothetical protein